MNRCTRLLVAVTVVFVVGLPGLAAQAATPTPTPTSTPTKTRPTYRYTPPDLRGERKERLASAERYMDQVAAKLGEPGVWVDPAVKSLSPREVAELNQAAKTAKAPIRIAVIPAESIDVAPFSSRVYTRARPAWEGEEIADQLYDRVGVEGVYAVLTHARSSSQGRGLHAVQRADHGPTYHVGSAVDQAVDCCSPDYEDMLAMFIQRAQEINKPFYVDVAP